MPAAKLSDGEGEFSCGGIEGYGSIVRQSKYPHLLIVELGLVREYSLNFLTCARRHIGDAPKGERPRLKERRNEEWLGRGCKGVACLIPPNCTILGKEKPLSEDAARVVMLLSQPYEAQCEFSASIHWHHVQCRANA